jgi:riboflavin synthase
MFTGIIERLGRIESLKAGDEGARLAIRLEPSNTLWPLAVGASIAVNGCCLTVVERDDASFQADLSLETLRRTSFRALKPGRIVNLEPPLVAGKEFGGHFVQGHVDGLGHVERLAAQGAGWWLRVRVPQALARYMAVKGSLAIDGISLTIATFDEDAVEAAIIPYTYSHTNLRELVPGDPVNLECDILAKYIERLMEARREESGERLTLARLLEEGF